MKNTVKTAFFGTALAALMLPAFAQTSPAPEPPQQNSTINSRQENQQDRIGQGIQNGSLTPGEATRIENNEKRMSAEEARMRAANGGKLTAADRAKLDRQQAHLSKQIYNQKHDAQTQNTNPKSEVGKRAENQQDRIAQGIKSGQLTACEASNLERKEAGINREVRNDRAANGGKLTPQERRQVNRLQNHVSNQIYNKKHNGRRQ